MGLLPGPQRPVRWRVQRGSWISQWPSSGQPGVPKSEKVSRDMESPTECNSSHFRENLCC